MSVLRQQQAEVRGGRTDPAICRRSKNFIRDKAYLHHCRVTVWLSIVTQRDDPDRSRCINKGDGLLRVLLTPISSDSLYAKLLPHGAQIGTRGERHVGGNRVPASYPLLHVLNFEYQ